jgi:hypothetical protein
LYNENTLYKYLERSNIHINKMNSLILVFILFTLYINQINGESLYNLRLRNAILRIYIASDKKQLISEYSKKTIVKSKVIINKYYNKLLSKMHDINLMYNNLTDEEREFLEFIISLCY